MIQDLTQGRIFKGSIAQISVHVLPPCFDPEKVTDLVLNFYTEIGGGSVEFSGDTITLEGNIATVVFQPIQLDVLDDGLLRYNVSYNYDDEPKTVDLETRFYIKTPNPYEPIKYVTEDTVKEIVDEKVDEGGFATSAETVELISEAMEAESARTESTYAKAEDLEQAINAETARTESTYAKKSDIPSLQGYATETFVDGRVNAEAARAESAYAKPADITAALEGYNPTDNFKTINGNSIIGEGDIEIQGGAGLEIINYNDIDAAKGQEIYANPEKYAIRYDNGFLRMCVFFAVKKDSFAEHSVYFRGPVTKGSSNLDGEFYTFWEMYLSDSGSKSITQRYYYYTTRNYVDTALSGKVSNVNGVSGIWRGTQAEYDAIATKDPNTLYVIKG